MSWTHDDDGGLREHAERAAEEADYRAWIEEMESLAGYEQFKREISDGQIETGRTA